MSDLIIKPSGTSANFKVQNPSGTDKIVMNSSGTITTGTLGSGVTFPAGHILQVQSFAYTDDNKSGTGTTFSDTGLTVSITPTATSSKIMVMAQVSMGASSNYRYAIRLVRDSTDIFVGDASGTARIRATASHLGTGGHSIDFTFPVMFLDSPSTTSATTYKIQAAAEQSGGSWYLNRGASHSDNSTVYVVASSITVMEISA